MNFRNFGEAFRKNVDQVSSNLPNLINLYQMLATVLTRVDNVGNVGEFVRQICEIWRKHLVQIDEILPWMLAPARGTAGAGEP